MIIYGKSHRSTAALSPPAAHSATSYAAATPASSHYSAVPTISSNYGYGGGAFSGAGYATAPPPPPGTNCIKIGLPGKLIFSKRKGLREVLFS